MLGGGGGGAGPGGGAGATDAARVAERNIRDVLVLRCSATCDPRGNDRQRRDAFLEAAGVAFDVEELEVQLGAQLLLAYKKVMGASTDAFPSNNQIRGPRSARRRRSPAV